ncbi:uncharacterized protein LOC143011766 [Genypterus blacodes]|uniref:uncharacterized protein LOC143011766 n=1 Tax=Genypterus blacodes TaxID=154954 RepID=UPI003F773E96
MGNAQSYVVASLSLSSVYLFYAYFYCSHKLLETNVLHSDKLPSFAYLFTRYVVKAVSRRTGRLHTTCTKKKGEVVYTVINCRLDSGLLRRFCSAAGYGWDFPDSEGRDLPLCFPELLCLRLLLVVLSDDKFSLSPAGLVRVCQSVKTLQPVDELKKGQFTLQVRVLEYRPVDAGVEVDIGLCATARSGCPIWESVLTLLSQNQPDVLRGCVPENVSRSELCAGQLDEPEPSDVKQVELRVPCSAGLRFVWSFADYSPHRVFNLPARLFGYRSQAALSLWMLSVCLAEIEKHKGVGAIAAPISVKAHFVEPLFAPGKVVVKFWEADEEEHHSSARRINFHMEQHGSSKIHVAGLISRS